VKPSIIQTPLQGFLKTVWKVTEWECKSYTEIKTHMNDDSAMLSWKVKVQNAWIIQDVSRL
jgi:hypothetical protein